MFSFSKLQQGFGSTASRLGNSGTLSNIGSGLLTGASFVGRGIASSMSQIIALGGALVVFLLTQLRK